MERAQPFMKGSSWPTAATTLFHHVLKARPVVGGLEVDTLGQVAGESKQHVEASAGSLGVGNAINGERAGCGSGYHTADRGVKG